MIDKQQVYRHFNRHAHEYDQFAGVQKIMAKQIAEWIESVAPFDRMQDVHILDIGCGTGMLTEMMAARYPLAQIVALDLCEQMIEQTRQRLQGRQQTIAFHVADAEEWQPRLEPFDLIVSNATFQWFNQTELTVHKYMERLKYGGIMFIATFLPGTFVELHDSSRRAAQLEGVAEWRFGQTFVSELEWRKMLAPFAIEFTRVSYPLHFASVRTFLDAVKRVGAGNALTSQGNHGYASKSLVRRMVAEYERVYSDSSGGIQATYEVAYILVKRPMTGGYVDMSNEL